MWDIIFYIAVFNVVVWLVMTVVCGLVYLVGLSNYSRPEALNFLVPLALALLSQVFCSVGYVMTERHVQKPQPCEVCETKFKMARDVSYNPSHFNKDIAEYIKSPCVTPQCINNHPSYEDN